MCSVLRQAPNGFHVQDSYSLLNDPKEIDLLKYISTFTDVVADCAINRTPNKICNYVQKLATYFHSFYG
ncbi:MAG: arginine--tRNA ligase, partial [Erysipelotrichaceae bacterium]|nr:arginine--tRNA ligase [Erysipelotrichaceae bacterium]